jgi:hypothetical protein
LAFELLTENAFYCICNSEYPERGLPLQLWFTIHQVRDLKALRGVFVKIGQGVVKLLITLERQFRISPIHGFTIVFTEYTASAVPKSMAHEFKNRQAAVANTAAKSLVVFIELCKVLDSTQHTTKTPSIV